MEAVIEMRKAVRAMIVLGMLTCTVAAVTWAVGPVNQNRAGVAIEGYDPVAYFTAGEPVKGSSEWSHEWNGATWWFSSEENRRRFAGAPERYASQYGGYCAYAVSENSTAGIDPEAWTIVDDRLYLNYSRKIQRRWSQDITGRIARADANWPRLLKKE